MSRRRLSENSSGGSDNEGDLRLIWRMTSGLPGNVFTGSETGVSVAVGLVVEFRTAGEATELVARGLSVTRTASTEREGISRISDTKIVPESCRPVDSASLWVRLSAGVPPSSSELS
jgi:hypothetical protein